MYKPEASNRVKMQLVLDAIVKKENVEVSDEDVENAVKEEAAREGREAEEFKKSLNDRQMEYLRGNAAIRKVVDMIVANASVEDKDESERVSADEAAKAVEEVAKAADEAEEEAKAEAKPRKRTAKKQDEKTEEGSGACAGGLPVGHQVNSGMQRAQRVGGVPLPFSGRQGSRPAAGCV